MIPYTCGSSITFQLGTPDTLKVVVFDEEGVKWMTMCNKHDEAFTMDAWEVHSVPKTFCVDCLSLCRSCYVFNCVFIT